MAKEVNTDYWGCGRAVRLEYGDVTVLVLTCPVGLSPARPVGACGLVAVKLGSWFADYILDPVSAGTGDSNIGLALLHQALPKRCHAR